jgi:G3E family GTPase
VIIESTGIAEPMQVAEAFFMNLDDGKGVLNSVARLDNCITVVDASSFFDFFYSVRQVAERWPQPPGAEPTEEDERSVCHLLSDQIEFANVVVLNKCDLVDGRRLEETKRLLRTMNPTAVVVDAVRSAVDLNVVLFTQHFNEEFAARAKGWMSDIQTGVRHVPETEEYGIGSFVYRCSSPFHPKRLHAFITANFLLQETAGGPAEAHEEPVGQPREHVIASNRERYDHRVDHLGTVLRSKGYVWIGSPSRLGLYGVWSQAGNILSLDVGGGWGVFPETAPRPGEPPRFIEKAPCQELVFIGQNLKKDAIVAALDACALTAEESQQLQDTMVAAGDAAAAMLMFDDPFESWVLPDADAEDWEDVDE